jgi:superfamily II DNA or RNA helicase
MNEAADLFLIPSPEVKTPVTVSPNLVLRPYQAECHDAIFEEWQEHRATLLCVPTGGGKTPIYTAIIQKIQPQRTLILTHRKKLVRQIRNTIEQFGRLECEVEAGDLRAEIGEYNRVPVVIAMVQTMISGKEVKRLERFRPEDFDLLVLEEAHHCLSPSWLEVVEHFKRNEKLKILGVTATPDRRDEKALGRVFTSVAKNIEILELVQKGWLVMPMPLFAPIEGLDYSHIRVTAGELNGADLDAVMEKEETVQGLIEATFEVSCGMEVNSLFEFDPAQWAAESDRQTTKRLKTLIFASNVKCAEMYANILNRVRPDSALWICGETPDDETEDTFKRFALGHVQYLVNVGVCTEGYDCPGIELIVLGRKTLSRSLLAQMIGRGTRTLTGILEGLETVEERLTAISNSTKPNLIVLDFLGQTGRLKLATVGDCLGGNYEEDVIEAANKRAEKSGNPSNMVELLEEEALRIKEEKEKRRQEEEARKAKLVARTKYRKPIHIDPFSAFDIVPERARAWDDGRQLSEKQRALFVKHIGDPNDFENYAQQKQLLNQLFHRWKNNLASLRQCATLKKHGYETKDLKMSEASSLIDALAKNHWKRPEPTLPKSDSNGDI